MFYLNHVNITMNTSYQYHYVKIINIQIMVTDLMEMVRIPVKKSAEKEVKCYDDNEVVEIRKIVLTTR